MRRRKEYLVTRVEKGGERLEHRLLGPVGDHHLGPVDPDSRIASDVLGNCLAQRPEARRGRVFVVFGVVTGACRRGHDVFRGGEIGLTCPEADDVEALGTQLSGSCADAEGG